MSSISAADKMILSHFNRRNVLKTRSCSTHWLTLSWTRGSASSTKTCEAPEGGSFFKIDSLSLIKSHMMTCRVGMTVMHRIDESSPLYGKTNKILWTSAPNFSYQLSALSPIPCNARSLPRTLLDQTLYLEWILRIML